MDDQGITQMDSEGNVIGHHESLEAFFDWQRRQDTKVLAQLHPTQQAITFGTKVVRFHPMGGRLLVIFGDIYTHDRMHEVEFKAGCESEHEFNEIWANTERMDANGYSYGWWYSILDSEPGSANKLNLWPVTDDMFAHAEANEWDHMRFDPAHKAALESLYYAYRTHLRTVTL